MAAKSARQQTDRVTVRLPVNQIRSMQALVDAGMYRNTTDVVYNAVKELLLAKGSQAKQTIEAEQGMLDLRRKLAEIEAIKGKLGLLGISRSLPHKVGMGCTRKRGPGGMATPPGQPRVSTSRKGGAHTPCNHSLEPLLGTPKSRT